MLWSSLKPSNTFKQIGALTSSSSYMASKFVYYSGLKKGHIVLELGAGSGAITKKIVDVANPKDVYCIELDSGFNKDLKKLNVNILNEDARDLSNLLDDSKIQRPDIIMSSLPWSLMDYNTQRDIMIEVGKISKENTIFSAYLYRFNPMKGKKTFVSLLNELYEDVQISKTVWLNLPPATIITARGYKTFIN